MSKLPIPFIRKNTMNNNFNDPENDEIIEWLEEEGALEWVGMADNGERILSFKLDKLKEVAPEIYEAFMEDMDQHLIRLMDAGLVELHYDEDLNAKFKISEEGRRLMREYGFEMDWDNYEGPNN